MATVRPRGPAAAALALLLVGCGGLPSSDGGGGFVGQTYVAASVSVGGTARPVVSGSELRLTFEQDRIGASAGCNSMSGTGGIEDGVLVVADLAMTEMACDAALMQQEAWWAGFLVSGPDAEVGELALILSDGTSTVEMTSLAAVADAPLEGTDWQAETIVEGEAASSLPAGTSASLTVDAGTLTVTVAGCRSTAVEVQAGADRLLFDPQPFAGSTCTGAAAELDAVVAGVFGGGQVDYRIDRDVLSVTGASGVQLDFRA